MVRSLHVTVFRLHGSYEALKYGSVLDGLADLTGGVAESILLKSDPTGSGRLLLELLDMTSVVTANVQVEKAKGESSDKSKNGHPEVKLANGISLGTNYRVYAVQKVQTVSGELVQLVHLRAGTDSASYLGSWAPGSEDWDTVDHEERARLGGGGGQEAGEFWMPYMDFIKTFTHLEVVHLDSDTARDEPSMADKRRWSMRFYSGAWQRGVTAGGCRNNSGDTLPPLQQPAVKAVCFLSAAAPPVSDTGMVFAEPPAAVSSVSCLT